MVILNVMGKIEPMCVSDKLKLYVSNLPKDENNNWHDSLIEEMETALKLFSVQSEIQHNRYGRSNVRDIKTITKNLFPKIDVETMSDRECVEQIADEMICLYFDYKYEDMPVGDWTTNCFDGRFCEGDYVDKIVNFVSFVCNPKMHGIFPQIPESAPRSIYFSDDYNEINNYRFLFSGTTGKSYLLDNLRKFGCLLDEFLVTENDYYFFDYLCRELYQVDQNHFSANQCQKLYSLCEFFLEKDSDWELDEKLPPFINYHYSLADREKIAMIARQIRNKVAHGDFSNFRDKIEEYATDIMEKNGYWFDYTEYSRQNWAIMNLAINLLDAVQHLAATILVDKQSIIQLKEKKLTKKTYK